MPRRNNRKKELYPPLHAVPIPNQSQEIRPGCFGCAFAGDHFKCLSSDGKCLKTREKPKERDRGR